MYIPTYLRNDYKITLFSRHVREKFLKKKKNKNIKIKIIKNHCSWTSRGGDSAAISWIGVHHKTAKYGQSVVRKN